MTDNRTELNPLVYLRNSEEEFQFYKLHEKAAVRKKYLIEASNEWVVDRKTTSKALSMIIPALSDHPLWHAGL